MPFSFRRQSRGHLFAGALALGVGLVLSGTTPVWAQGTTTNVPNAMQGFTQNRDEPIEIEAESLEMRDKKKEAVFSGDVRVKQGDTTMRSKRLVVFYDGGTGGPDAAAPGAAPKAAPAMKSATPGPSGSSSIRRLEAQGSVVVTQKDQVVTGQTAIFDTRANLISMTGGVVLTKDKNVLVGDRLVVNMTTGVSKVEAGAGNGGRVRGLFQGSPAAPAAPGAAGKPAAAPPTALGLPKSR